MYTIAIIAKRSGIDGQGVFADQDMQKGTIVWQFTKGHDKKISILDFNCLEESKKLALERIAYLSPTTGMWVMPPEDDPACYTNHDPSNHNLSVVADRNISDEPFFIANRDIKAGEEITNNYLEFDENSTLEKFTWLN